MSVIQDLIENGNFEQGELDPWMGENVDVIASPCPVVVGDFSVRLKGGGVDATLFQNVNVITGETYQLTFSIATARKGTSPPVKIRVEYLNRLLEVVGFGLDESISQNQLPSGAEGKFNSIQLLTTIVPEEARFARLIIKKEGLVFSPSVIIDNVSMSRIKGELTQIPNTYVGNTGTDTTSIVFEETFNTLTVGNTPNAMIRAFNGETRLLYIAFGNEQYVSVIDVSTQTEITTISVMGTTNYYFNRNIVVSPDGSKVYIASNQSQSGFVNILDTGANQLAGVVTVGNNPSDLAITSNGSTVYVAYDGSTSVTELDVESATIIETFDLSGDFSCIQFIFLVADDQQLVVGGKQFSGGAGADFGSFAAYIISTGEKIVQVQFAPIDDLEFIGSMAVSLNKEYVYFANTNQVGFDPSTAFLRVYDISTWTEVTNLTFISDRAFFCPTVIGEVSEQEGESLIFVSVVGDFTRLYEISRCQDEFTSVTNISMDNFSNGYFSISTDRSTIVTANQSGNSVSFIGTSTFNEDFILNVGTGPQVLVVD
ncbi:NTTRR-F1 domain [Bacillus carboniphilus]|uniref:NTTRR-F1 domain n=1 Tax=Bacillus carboniphilus TaxID=86663 RepID=A0ABY9JV26_9BACI|nr:NTTRR-F1 domain [Bacillus carboniphilus]WLR43264.1 NTTRR-F1 domain [Bacillus carboniphilus]